jgi:hypothetical protein
VGKYGKEIFLNFHPDVVRQNDGECLAASLDQQRAGDTPRSEHLFEEYTGIQEEPRNGRRITPLTPDVTVSSSIGALGEKDLYCFDLAAPTRVVVQSRGLTSGIEPCMEVYTGALATLAPNGSICVVSTVLRLDLTLAAGTYFVLVQDHSSSATGNYNLLLELIEGGTVLTPGASAPDTITPIGDLDLFTFSLTATKQVIVQVTPSGIQPCIELFKGTPAQPVSGGPTCSNGTAQLNISLNRTTRDWHTCVSP